MPKGRSTGAMPKKYTLDDGVWQWRIMVDGEAFRKQQFTEERLTKSGDDMIQLVVKVGNAEQNIIIMEYLVFSDSSEWKLNEFLKSAGIYPGEVEYFLSAEMCVGLRGQCKTINRTKDNYTNTHIASWLEAGEQQPGSLPGFLMSEDMGVAVSELQAPSEPVDDSVIPF